MDMQKLVEAVTCEVIKRMGDACDRKRILVLGKDPDCPIAACLRRQFDAETAPSLDNAADYDFAVVPVWYLDKLQGKGDDIRPAMEARRETLDFSGQRLLHERELREKCTSAVGTVRLGRNTIVTSLAADYIRQRRLTILRG